MISAKPFFFLLILDCLLLAGCLGGNHYAPVVEVYQQDKQAGSSHVVSRGETLYSIAWRYNLDFKGLAAANRINPPYTIYPSQKIRLTTTVAATKTAPVSNSKQQTNNSAKPQRAAPSATPKTVNSTSKKTTAELAGLSKANYPFQWRWPASGKVVRAYSGSSDLHKGIDLNGKLGEPVHAANSGKVVYAGSGLVGYGKLLIIKHDEHYLSAYGHNSQLLVKEGSVVKVGQQIAKFGDTGTDKVKLHFEIRRDGKPINPLGLLPKR